MRISVSLVIAIISLTSGVAFGQGYWSEPQLFTPANSSSSDWKVIFGPGDLSFYVTSERDGHFAESDIYVSQRPDTSSPWSSPTNATELNSGIRDTMSWISPNGLEGFASRRTGPGDGDIYRTTRASVSDPWGSPALVSELSSTGEESQLALTANGLTGVFMSSRPSGLGDYDIWQTSRPDLSSPWSTPINLSGINSSAHDDNAYLSADGLAVFFGSSRSGGEGGYDIYTATRDLLTDAFSTPTLITEISSVYNEGNPTLSSSDGKSIFFTSNRPGGSGGNDIWYSAWVPEPTSLSVDIKPGSCPNPFNLKSRGKLPVALLGTEDFDVSAIDPASITLARADGVGGSVAPFDGPPGPNVKIHDVSTPFEGELCDCHNVEGDGIDDLSIKFSRPEAVTALELREFDPGATVELVVSGTLLDGTAFSGSDCILIVPQSDFDEDNDVDQSDFGHLQVCYRGPMKGVDLACEDADIDGDGDVDISDFGRFQRCISGANNIVDPRCAD